MEPHIRSVTINMKTQQSAAAERRKKKNGREKKKEKGQSNRIT